MTIYVNHLGFTPSAVKHCLMGGLSEIPLAIRDERSGAAVFEGRLRRVPSDFGTYTVGDFSQVQQPGLYRIEAGRERSQPFAVGDDVYDRTLQQIVGYFTLQRCGNTNLNWLGQPCHTDDGICGDTRTRLDVEGGWHDACDLRKWVSATLFGLLGLLRLKTVLHPAWDAGQIEDELRWGNRYFLKMQTPAGYVMSHCGGDYFVHADNNRWTDNVADGRDDRVIDVRPCDISSQWLFVLAETGIARLTTGHDSGYAGICREAALRCLSWLLAEDRTRAAGDLGIALAALAELHQLTLEQVHVEQAARFATRLLSLQVSRQEDTYHLPVWGFFWDRWDDGDSPTKLEPHKAIWKGCWPLLGLGDLIEHLPDHPDAPHWREAVRLYCSRYLQPMASRNAFGMVPYGLYRADPGGGHKLGKFWYRWFHEANPDWYVGVNANLASAGVGLLRAARLFGEPTWAGVAQRQLDWILGVNPFDASTVVGSGHNNPQHMFGGEFDPATPFVPGAVMNGISGDADDRPQLRPGSYQECEYWTPMVAYVMWLMAELERS